MKLSKLFIIALIVMIAAGNGFSQVRQSQIELYGGIAFPMAPDGFKESFNMGYSIHGQYVMFLNPKLGISFGLAYEPFSVNKDELMDGVDDASFNVFELGIGVRPYLSSPEANTQFFVFGMATYNMMKMSAEGSYEYYDYYSGTWYTEEYDESIDENKMGIAVGGGLEMPLNDRMNLIVQGLYRFIFFSEDDDLSDENVSFLGITAGIVF